MHVKIATSTGTSQCVGLVLSLPLVGPWQATAQSDGRTKLSGPVTISIADSMRFAGTVLTSAPYSGRIQTFVVAGGAGLQKSLDGKAYARVPGRLVVADMLTAAGETLAATSDAMAAEFRHWLRSRNPMRRELETVLARLGLPWRHLPDGTVWAGSETWPASKLANYVVVGQNETEKRLELAADVPCVYPGETFLGRHVAAVEHRLSGTRLRTMVTFG